MNSQKLFCGMCGLLALLAIGVVVSVAQANGVLEQHATGLADVKAANQMLDRQKSQLISDKKDVAKYSSLNDIAKTVVPQDKDQAEAVREIVNLASQSGIPKLSTIAFPPSTLGTATITATPGTTVIPTVPTSAKTLTQVTPVKGIPGVLDLQITITQANTDPVSYQSFITFLSKLEQNRRTAEVSSITVQPQPKNPNAVAFTLVIDEFIKP